VTLALILTVVPLAYVPRAIKDMLVPLAIAGLLAGVIDMEDNVDGDGFNGVAVGVGAVAWILMVNAVSVFRL
jgi:hypothetical protein